MKRVDVEFTDGTKGYVDVPSQKELNKRAKDMRKMLNELLPMLGICGTCGMESAHCGCQVDTSNVFTCKNCGHEYSDKRPCPECGEEKGNA